MHARTHARPPPPLLPSDPTLHVAETGKKNTTTLDGLEKWVGRDYVSNVKDAIKGAELKDRARSRDRGDAAGGKGGQKTSAAGGKDALYKWAEQQKMMLELGKFYNFPFDERFILISSPGEVEITKASLKCAATLPSPPTRVVRPSPPAPLAITFQHAIAVSQTITVSHRVP